VQSPELKPQYYKKKKKREREMGNGTGMMVSSIELRSLYVLGGIPKEPHTRFPRKLSLGGFPGVLY
jgi:hypothetical protein